MAETTGIEWTDATWNPVTGCTKVSPGCAHCYAEAITLRFRRGGPFLPGKTTIKTHPERLSHPGKWRQPKRIFVNSMSDLFHEDIPPAFLDDVFRVMAENSRHTFQILTKRPEQMMEYVERTGHRPWPPNVWAGVSVENQYWADRRIPLLAQVPASIRFLSVEPLLKAVTLDPWLREIGPNDWPLLLDILHWIIVGAESGPRARPMLLQWVRDIRDECIRAGVAFFFKQSLENGRKVGTPLLDGRRWTEMPATPSLQGVLL